MSDEQKLENRKKEAQKILIGNKASTDISLSPDDIKNIYGSESGIKLCDNLDKGNDKNFHIVANIVENAYKGLILVSTRSGSLVLINAKLTETENNVTAEVIKRLEAEVAKRLEADPKMPVIAEIDQNPRGVEMASRAYTERLRADAKKSAKGVKETDEYRKSMAEIKNKNVIANGTRNKSEQVKNNSISNLSGREVENSNYKKEYNSHSEKSKDNYNELRDLCAGKAVEYLKKYGGTIITKINSNEYKDNKEKDLQVSKILFVCVIAAMSSNVSHRKVAYEHFSKIKNHIKIK